MQSGTSSTANMVGSHSPIPVSLVVAATRTMGIGWQGGLPWPPLKQEMAYFTRVTKRSAISKQMPTEGAPTEHVNAVVMGRKTWLSIPPKHRPLKGRVNVVLSRQTNKTDFRDLDGTDSGPVEGPYSATSLRAAVEGLQRRSRDSGSEPNSGELRENMTRIPSISRIYIIGGAEIYKSALELPECTTILMSRIYTDFTCDTFFPLVLSQSGEYEGWVEHERAVRRGLWKRRPKEELDAWVGEAVPEGKLEQDGVEWEFELWKRQGGEDGGS